ncbi:hypothetical protein QR680_016291 [Steinernema hermaphroditum]|uniref:Uncharacterized protein n=1 Tax=Steinernema hermaphroditum TaxID=289476 RepID=A0AA39HCP5_9BILA|nr:hypothetical protein QR680_016291 [Steinernema hermaphroditum]
MELNSDEVDFVYDLTSEKLNLMRGADTLGRREDLRKKTMLKRIKQMCCDRMKDDEKTNFEKIMSILQNYVKEQQKRKAMEEHEQPASAAKKIRVS